MRASPSFVVVVAVSLACFCGIASCSKDASGPNVGAAVAADADDAPPPPVVTKTSQSLLFSYVDAAGRVMTVPNVDAVPEAVRKRVLVVDLQKTPEQRQAHRYAFFADLTSMSEDGTFPVVVVSRYQAVGHASTAALPPSDGSVIVYSATWCGYCKKAKAWLKEHNVPFIERDVEKTEGAAAEVAQKLKTAGVPGGGIPVIDWGGNIVVGFDVPQFEKLLQAGPPKAPTSDPTTTPPTTPPTATPKAPPSTE